MATCTSTTFFASTNLQSSMTTVYMTSKTASSTIARRRAHLNTAKKLERYDRNTRAYLEVELLKGGERHTGNDRHKGEVHQGGEDLLQEDGAVVREAVAGRRGKRDGGGEVVSSCSSPQGFGERDAMTREMDSCVWCLVNSFLTYSTEAILREMQGFFFERRGGRCNRK